jgi:CTP-dependent riboflavin kinase
MTGGTSIVVEGIVVRGLGIAAGIVRVQLPLVLPHLPSGYLPGIESLHGTINLQLDTPLRINNPDHTTPPIHWGGQLPEQFSLLAIEFECPVNTKKRSAWIYIPHNSPHRVNLFSIEVISEWIPEATPNTRCRVHIQRPHRQSAITIVS